MKFDSPIFDRIRVKPDPERVARDGAPCCEWPGCDSPGDYRAPKGRNAEGQYHRFCLEHVQIYNKNYNYFAGMNDAAVAAYQKSALTGHRPTWQMGVNKAGDDGMGDPAQAGFAGGTIDPFGFFRGSQRPAARPEPARRKLKPLEKKALEALSLDDEADKAKIKARFKELVKRHHPDANGGDRSSEDRLREIIQAYNVLKAAGFC
jgi:curved DNA-binding protein CbpA